MALVFLIVYFDSLVLFLTQSACSHLCYALMTLFFPMAMLTTIVALAVELAVITCSFAASAFYFDFAVPLRVLIANAREAVFATFVR